MSQKKFKALTIVLLGLVAAVTLCHKPLLLLGCKVALKKVISPTKDRIFSYETMQWEGDAIAISKLHIQDSSSEISVERIELKLKGDLLHLKLEPELHVLQPQIFLSKARSTIAPALPFYRSARMQPHWHIEKGVLTLPSAGSFYFALEPGNHKDSLGKVVFSHDPNLSAPAVLTADLCRQEGNLQCQFQLHHAGPFKDWLALAALMQPQISSEWERAEGDIECEGWVNLSKNYTVEQVYCHAEGKCLDLHSSTLGIHLQTEEIKAALSYPMEGTSGSFWNRSHASLSLKEGHYQFLGNGLKVHVPAVEVAFEPESEPEVHFLGNLLQGDRSMAFELSGKAGAKGAPFQWELNCVSAQGQTMQALLSLNQGQGKDLSLQIHVENASSEHLNFWGGSLGECLEGTARGDATIVFHEGSPQVAIEKCQLENLHWSFPEKQLTVSADEIVIHGSYAKKAKQEHTSIQLQLDGEKIAICHPWADLYLPTLKQKSMQLASDTKEGKWRGEIPLTEAQLHYRDAQLNFANLEGALKLDGDQLQASSLYAECEGLAVRGDIDISWTQGLLSLTMQQMAGNAENFLTVLGHFPSLPKITLPIQGNFSSGDQGLALKRNQGTLDWNFKGTFGDLRFPLNATTAIKNGACEVSFDSKTGCFCLEKAQGTWQLSDGLPLTVQVAQFSSHSNGTMDFAAKVIDAKEEELVAFQGQAKRASPAQWNLAFNPSTTHLCGMKLNISRCILNNQMLPVSFEMKPTFKCQDIHTQAAFLQNAGFLPPSLSVKNLQDWQMEGTLTAQMSSEDVTNGFSFWAESKDLKVKGKSWSSFHLSGQKIGEKWLIEKLQADHLSLKAAFLVEATGINIPQFEGSWQGLELQGRGYFYSDEKRADFHLKHKAGDVSLAHVHIGKVCKPQEGDFSLQQLQFSLTPVFLSHCIDARILPETLRKLTWEGNLDGNGEFSFGTQGCVFQGTLPPGNYGFGEKSFAFEQLQVRYEKQALMLRAKLKVEEQPLWSTLQIQAAKASSGILKLFDHPQAEGLKCLFAIREGKLLIDSIQGSCYGLSCNLSKNPKRTLPLATVLSGEIQIDVGQLCAILPAKIQKGLDRFQLGKGYLWRGDLMLGQEMQNSFKIRGTLCGREFESFGYRLQHLESTLEATPEQITISNLRIDDPAGFIGIQKIELKKQEGWQLSIPQIIMRELQPSLLCKTAGEPQVVNPFKIKNFTMTDIQGNLSELSTLQGSGHLNFINQCQKETSLFDVPLEVIKKIGLDPDLLTPIQGDFDVELRGDKFYLLSLQNAFSEGRRTQFFFAPNKDLSYIDLSGKVHIDLNMRQDVMLKVAEPFTLTIRGTLDQLRYGFQH